MARRTRTSNVPRTLSGTRLRAVFPTTAFAAVSLTLLVLFLILIPIARRNGEVQLPLATGEGRAPVLMTRSLSIARDGALILDGKRLQPAAASGAFTALAGQAPPPTLMVRGDRGLTYRQVKAVLDQLRAAGVQDIRLEVAVGADATSAAAGPSTGAPAVVPGTIGSR